MRFPSQVTPVQDGQQVPAHVTMLVGLRGIGPEFANVLHSECLYRYFDNRRQVASYSSLAPTPWQSGSIDREQGVFKGGQSALAVHHDRVGCLWTRHQPDSVLSQWFRERSKLDPRRKASIVALARKHLVALWKYVTAASTIMACSGTPSSSATAPDSSTSSATAYAGSMPSD